MSYSVKPGSILGRIGTGIGRGLADQLPKEIERGRLAEGLKGLETEGAGLTPFQRLSRLATMPGVTPQLLQSATELLKQEGIADSLKDKAGSGSGEGRPIPKSFQPKPVATAEKPSPSITKPEGVTATREQYKPRTFAELQQRAGELLRDDPALYQGDPQAALNAAKMEDQQNQQINQAYQVERKGQQDVLNTLRSELAGFKEILGAAVPGNVFNEVQDRAIEAVNSGQVSEKQAAEDAAKELDRISRDYEAINTIGDFSVLTRSPSGNRDALKSIRNKFKERDDLENFADTLIATNGLSAPKAYYMAFPVSENKELNNTIAKLPKLDQVSPGGYSFKKGYPEKVSYDPTQKTLDIAPKLAEAMGKDGSPLAIATELQGRGYDPKAWMNYLNNNRKKLNLSERQGRELDKPRDFTNSLNDVWMFVFSGLDKLVEQ